MERSLSQNEAKVILDLEWRNQKTVTLADLCQMLDASASYARYMAHRLVKKGWFERLRPGLFQLIPADRGREGVADTHPLTVGAQLVSPYFYSFGTACTHHGLTDQVFTEVYLASRQRRQPVAIRGKRYVFVHVKEQLFFGFREISVLGEPVQMAIIERALLDAIDRTRFAGGLGEVSQITSRAVRKVSWDILLDLAGRWASSALVQRLGYFFNLHRVHIPDDVQSELLNIVRPQSKILLGPRRKWGTSGKLIRPWNVIENVPREVLTAGWTKPLRGSFLIYWPC